MDLSGYFSGLSDILYRIVSFTRENLPCNNVKMRLGINVVSSLSSPIKAVELEYFRGNFLSHERNWLLDDKTLLFHHYLNLRMRKHLCLQVVYVPARYRAESSRFALSRDANPDVPAMPRSISDKGGWLREAEYLISTTLPARYPCRSYGLDTPWASYARLQSPLAPCRCRRRCRAHAVNLRA